MKKSILKSGYDYINRMKGINNMKIIKLFQIVLSALGLYFSMKTLYLLGIGLDEQMALNEFVSNYRYNCIAWFFLFVFIGMIFSLLFEVLRKK